MTAEQLAEIEGYLDNLWQKKIENTGGPILFGLRLCEALRANQAEALKLREEVESLRSRLRSITTPVPNMEDYKRLRASNDAMRAAIELIELDVCVNNPRIAIVDASQIDACHEAAKVGEP